MKFKITLLCLLTFSVFSYGNFLGGLDNSARNTGHPFLVSFIKSPFDLSLECETFYPPIPIFDEGEKLLVHHEFFLYGKSYSSEDLTSMFKAKKMKFVQSEPNEFKLKARDYEVTISVLSPVLLPECSDREEIGFDTFYRVHIKTSNSY